MPSEIVYLTEKGKLNPSSKVCQRSTKDWLEWLRISTYFQIEINEPDIDTFPCWAVACYSAANEWKQDHLHMTRKGNPTEWADWKKFMLLLTRDKSSRDAIESAYLLKGDGYLGFINDLKADVLGAIQHSTFNQLMTQRQERRNRRIDGRYGWFDNPPPARPTDEEFLKEAHPPKKWRRWKK